MNSVIRDKTISDNGILVYCYLKAIQRADINYYPMSVELMDYFFRHTFDMETRDKKKYVDGLNDLEAHNLIRKITVRNLTLNMICRRYILILQNPIKRTSNFLQ